MTQIGIDVIAHYFTEQHFNQMVISNEERAREIERDSERMGKANRNAKVITITKPQDK